MRVFAADGAEHHGKVAMRDWLIGNRWRALRRRWDGGALADGLTPDGAMLAMNVAVVLAAMSRARSLITTTP